MEGIKTKISKFRYKGILAIVLVFAVITLILFLERSGIQYNYENKQLNFLPAGKVVTKAEAVNSLKPEAVVLYNSSNEDSLSAHEQFCVILNDMKIGYNAIDVSEGKPLDFEGYDKAIVLLNDLTALGEDVFTLTDWVYDGGRALFALTLQKSGYTSIIESKLGIIESSYDNALVSSIYIEDGFMAGGGRAFNIPDAYDSGWAIQLAKEKSKVYAYTNDDRKLPLIWETDYGKGKFVVDNFGLYEKVMRGFFAASVSLLDDVCVYPVINGSAFYLDDFPSQIPSGDSTYIKRDYNTTIRDFYVNIWWPDMMNFSDKYGLRYTGLAIKSYDNLVDGSVSQNVDEGTFLNFGNMLMRKSGEIGYHGYNHQPLCFDNCDYKGMYDYKTWESYEAMKNAFDDLEAFCKKLFPDVEMSVYVPPSNILSAEGREFLINEYPQIKTISGIYFEELNNDYSCTQEFDVSKNGVVDQPRVISGCILDDFLKLAMISELNMHYINSHFTHPDDALDPDRGAEYGWEKLKKNFDSYLKWLYESAPSIRNFTGSEMSAAVQRFVAITVSREMKEDRMVLSLGNFYDEAQLMVRFNKEKPGKVDGGKLTHLTGNLYLLEAREGTVTIHFD